MGTLHLQGTSPGGEKGPWEGLVREEMKKPRKGCGTGKEKTLTELNENVRIPGPTEKNAHLTSRRKRWDLTGIT